jgi:molybdopterin converting factor small subunit
MSIGNPKKIKVFVEFGKEFSPIVHGIERENIELPEGATLQTLIKCLGEKYGEKAKKYLDAYPWVIGGEIITEIDKPRRKLKNGEWIKIIPTPDGG